jgi:molybdopterin adenylyltransferase
MLRIAVITLSDRASRGEYEDLSGKELLRLLKEGFPGIEPGYRLIDDNAGSLRNALDMFRDHDFIFTTGGTGIGPRDITPETTASWCEREIPGIAEFLRSESLKETATAVFSRGFAGIRGKTIVVNFPGSKRGAAFCLKLLLPLLEHGAQMAAGRGH